MVNNKLFLFFICLTQLFCQLYPLPVSPTAKSYFTQAELCKKEGDLSQAILFYQKAIDLDSTYADACQALGSILKQKEQFIEAAHYLEQALRYDPLNITTRFNLGCTYLNMGKIDDAINEFHSIYHHFPNTISALYNKGYTQKTAGMIDEAIETYQEVLQKNPNYDAAHLALGFAYLSKGDFEHGWKQHERYLKKSKKNADKLRLLLDNNNIKNKTILLYPEGGIGDTINFVRYAKRLKEMGATVITTVQKQLVPLLSLCPYIDQLSSSNKQIAYDASSTFMSLPAVFNDNERTFPCTIP